MKINSVDGGLKNPIPVGVMILSLKEFKVLFQVFAQLLNFQDFRLDSLGVTRAELKRFDFRLVPIRNRVDGPFWSRVDLEEFWPVGSFEPSSFMVVVEKIGAPVFEVRAGGPCKFFVKFPTLVRFVTSSMGAYELFLRTGYDLKDFEEVAKKIDIVANGGTIRPDGEGAHFARGVDERALGHYIDGVINGNVSSVRTRYLDNGRVGYWDPDKQAVVIEDGDRGTVFTPKEGEWWFENELR